MDGLYSEELTIPKPEHLGNTPWQLSKLTQFTVLFGKNGCGKSLLLRNIRDSDAVNCHYVIPERTGEIDYAPQYIQQQSNSQGRRDLSGGNFIGNYRMHVLARINAYFAARGNVRGNVMPADPSEVEAFITQLIPDFIVELSGTGERPYVFKRQESGQSVTNINQLSSGEAQLITMGLDILTIAAVWEIEGKDKRIILIDEPDAHIHPDLQARFADFLVHVSVRYKLQAIVSTHSTSLLAALGQFGGDKASIIYLERSKDVFKAESFTSVMKELAAVLGGHALMGPLFGAPLLLVEGDDDFRIWSQVPRYNTVNLSVIPSNGEEIKKYQKTLEKIFASLRDGNAGPSGYALLDGDKALPEDNPATPQKHIKFLQLNCHESENLYLTDEVLTLLGTDWDKASSKIVAQADNYGAKAEILKQAAGWNRQESDIKDVIEQIATILDSKRVQWSIRVARAIGKERPAGQIAGFLGESVLKALWGAAPEPKVVAAADASA